MLIIRLASNASLCACTHVLPILGEGGNSPVSPSQQMTSLVTPGAYKLITRNKPNSHKAGISVCYTRVGRES